jgi:putative membrane protein
LIKDFQVSGFWAALFASIFISVISVLLEVYVLGSRTSHEIHMPHAAQWSRDDDRRS